MRRVPVRSASGVPELDQTACPGRGSVRGLRGVTLAAALLITPAAAHVAGGGGFPDLGPFVFVAALLSVACVALADRRRSVGQIAALMAFTQPVLHVLFALSGHGSSSVVPTGQMAVSHLTAAAALTVLLAGADNVLWAFAALYETLLLTRVRTLFAGAEPIARPRIAASASSDVAAAFVRYLDSTAPRRGPPAVTCS